MLSEYALFLCPQLGYRTQAAGIAVVGLKEHAHGSQVLEGMAKHEVFALGVDERCLVRFAYPRISYGEPTVLGPYIVVRTGAYGFAALFVDHGEWHSSGGFERPVDIF